MSTVPAAPAARKPGRQPLPPPDVTGTLTTGTDTGLADLFNEAAVLTIVGPTGQKLYWVGVIADGGRIVGLTLRQFRTGLLYRVTFDGAKWECDCPDCVYRERTCKHIVALHHALTRPQDSRTTRDDLTGPGPDLEALARGDWLDE